eukprot:462558_1
MNTSVSNIYPSTHDSLHSRWVRECYYNAPLSMYFFWLLALIFSCINLLFGIYAIIKSSNDTDNKYKVDKLLFILILSLFIVSGTITSFHIGQSVYCISSG